MGLVEKTNEGSKMEGTAIISDAQVRQAVNQKKDETRSAMSTLIFNVRNYQDNKRKHGPGPEWSWKGKKTVEIN